ncbi:hypothetical protein H2198_001700 [Neophaeococcomyces mojaviensis]|uniref:Uncharacterized protein n=1 Tax=Neophaeococcomyces mojaviensis TaxID=3383035 RepID=A0ACC3AGE5_9EURO|nr:hypothetical protein H2198_001700 [Knufia sp. JES_112]
MCWNTSVHDNNYVREHDVHNNDCGCANYNFNVYNNFGCINHNNFGCANYNFNDYDFRCAHHNIDDDNYYFDD